MVCWSGHSKYRYAKKVSSKSEQKKFVDLFREASTITTDKTAKSKQLRLVDILNIKDYGIGIAKEDQERIFNKGFTGKNGRNTTYKSTGMGLYFSKKIIDKLNHSIEVESVKDKYTLFRIRFYKISDYLSVTKL